MSNADYCGKPIHTLPTQYGHWRPNTKGLDMTTDWKQPSIDHRVTDITSAMV